MSELPTNGNIVIPNDAFYPVNFKWIPRVGELIDLTSMIDLADKQPNWKFQFRVVQVVHTMTDVTDKSDPVSTGSHWVDVFVEETIINYHGVVAEEE